MSVDEQQHVAFPKLFGAPAYARPPSAVTSTDRPFDPDDLPILAELTPEERAELGSAALVARVEPGDRSGHGAYLPPGQTAPTSGAPGGHSGRMPALRARPFALRTLADRLRGRDRSRG